MPAQSDSQIILQMLSFIEANGGYHNSYFTGVSRCPADDNGSTSLIGEYLGPQMVYRTSSSITAQYLLEYFINFIGTDGSINDLAPDAKYIFIAKKNTADQLNRPAAKILPKTV